MNKEQTGVGIEEPPAETGEQIRDEPANNHPETIPQTSEAEKHPPRSVLREYFESLAVTAIMALFGMTFVVQAVKVPTGSMQNTILVGDHLLVNKFIFAPGPRVFFLPQREIRRGDIIVFKYPGKSKDPQFAPYIIRDDVPDNIPFKTNYVKRVVGLPGERVEIRGTQIFINGKLFEEHRVAAVNPPNEDDPRTSGNESGAPLKDKQGVPLVGRNAPSPGSAPYNVYWSPQTLSVDDPTIEGETDFRVPEGHYLVIGDNRENSQDGRFWGYVSRDLVIGQALFVYWSYDESAERSDAPFPLNIVWDFVNNTRWSRTGTLVR